MINTKKIDKYPIILPKNKKEIPTGEHEYKLHGIFVVCGRRNSGKSVAVSSKLRHMKQDGVCDRVFLISPTAISNSEMWAGLVDEEDIYEDMTNASVIAVLDEVKNEKREWDEYLEKLQIFKEYQRLLKSKKHTDEYDDEFMLKCYDMGIFDMDFSQPPVSKYGHKPVLHLVVDDCQSSALFNPSTKNKFLNAVIRHRHIADGLGISMWILIQNYATQSGLPKAIRENCTVLIVFPVKDTNMIKTIQQECGGEIGEDEFYKMFEYATDSPHSFLSIEFSPKKPEYKFRKMYSEFMTINSQGTLTTH